MKHILLFAFLFLSISAFSQDYINSIVQKSCECMNTIPDTLGTDEFNMKLGLCMIDAAMPFKKQLKKDYGIDLDKIDDFQGEKLGRLIGMKMASGCPNFLLKVTKKVNSKESVSDDEKTVEGTVAKVDKDFFLIFSVKDNSGKITKLYWITYVESEFDMVNQFDSLVDKPVQVKYKVQEIFDPKINDYRKINVLTKLELSK